MLLQLQRHRSLSQQSTSGVSRREEGRDPLPVAGTITLAVPFLSAKPPASLAPVSCSIWRQSQPPHQRPPQRCLVDALSNDQLPRIFVHRPDGTFLLRWRARRR
jgi:hypothetical protein